MKFDGQSWCALIFVDSSTVRIIMMAGVECGSLWCQRDSYARSLSTVVLSCTLSAAKDQQYGTYSLRLQDTVLFPEGGGQVS